MAFNARGLYLAKDLESPRPTTNRTMGRNPVAVTYGRKGKRSINPTGDQALRTLRNVRPSKIPGDWTTRCHRPGCMRYIWLSQVDEHLAFHDEAVESHEENYTQTIESADTSDDIDLPQAGPSTVPDTSIRNAPSLREHGPLRVARTPTPIDLSSIQPASNEPSNSPETTSYAPELLLPPPKTCLTCLDSIPSGKSYTLTCGHVWCQSCVRLKFRSSTQDLSLWPPKCCPTTPFSMHVARRILGTNMVNELNERAEELADKKRVYCCEPECGAYISRSNRDLIGDLAKCENCGGEMCLLCLSAMHPGKGCRDDEETRKFLEVVEREGYKKCKGCGTMCELMEGCNHITCDNCGYRFCYVCGTKDWKCRCPVFSDRDLDRRIDEAMAVGEPGVAWLIEQQRGQTNHGGGVEVDEPGPVPRKVLGGNRRPMWMM